MNTFYHNLQFPRSTVAKRFLTLAIGPWIPQTPDPDNQQDPREYWQKTNDDDAGEEED